MSKIQHIQTQFNSFRQRLMGQGNAATLARGAVSSFAVKIAGTAIAFVGQVVLTQFLGAESYGSYVYVLSWITIIAVIGRLGFDTAAIRFVAAYSSQQAWGLLRGFLRYSNQVIVVASAATAMGVALITWFLQAQYSAEVLYTFWIASVLLPFNNVLEVQQARLRGLKTIIRSQLPKEVIQPLLILVVLVAFHFLLPANLNAPMVMGIRLIATAIAVAIGFGFFLQVVPKEVQSVPPTFHNQEWLKVSFAMVLVTSFALIQGQTGTIMLGTFVDTTAVGLFSVASRIPDLLVFILVAVNSILGPLVASLHSQGDRKELQRIVRMGVQIVFCVSLSLAIILLLFGKQLLHLFGSEFTTAYPLLLILMISQLINAIAGPVGLLLNMTGYQNDAAKVLCISALVNVILNAILIPLYGALGAALAALITSLTWNGIMTVLVWVRLKIVAVALPKFLLPKSLEV